MEFGSLEDPEDASFRLTRREWHKKWNENRDKKSGRAGVGEVNSGGIQGSYEPSVKLKGFWGKWRQKEILIPLRYTRKKKKLLRGNLNFSIKYRSPILVFCRGEGLKGLEGWREGHWLLVRDARSCSPGTMARFQPHSQTYLSTLTSKGSLVIRGHVGNHTWMISGSFPCKKRHVCTVKFFIWHWLPFSVVMLFFIPFSCLRKWIPESKIPN